MSTSSSLFCEYCGAANASGASNCCFCDRSLNTEEAIPANTLSFTALSPLPIDTLLKGRYRIIKSVGQGGMGTVYRARDIGLNDRPVALKELLIYDPDAPESLEAIEAFKREAALLAGLQHANLPSVFEHFSENGRWYMAMTFIPGQTLEAYLEHTGRKKLPLHEVLEIGKQLSSVLYYLHTQYPPVIFRDVKPTNIMRTPDGHIYLIDFGVARRFKSGQKKDTTPFGSVGYAAPEQFGRSQTTPRSDIYSLGATLYELLTGHEPASFPLQFRSLRSLEPSTPFKLITLITQMLDQDEGKRPANMLIVEQKLQEIDSTPWQMTASAGFPPTPAPASNKSSRNSRKSLVTLLSLICLIAGGVIGTIIGTSNGEMIATNNARMNARAAAEAQASTAAAVAATQAAATATAAQIIALPDPYPPKGTLALFDPLSQANQWQEQSNTDFGGKCQFSKNGLQIIQSLTNKSYNCNESDIYQNFAVQVQMTIQQGDCGGINLRGGADGSASYEFDVCSDGTYYFFRYTSYTSSNSLTTNTYSKAIHEGTQENTLAVVANGSAFDLYVNKQKIESVSDSSYQGGTIGFTSWANTNPTTVLYQNVLIWALP